MLFWWQRWLQVPVARWLIRRSTRLWHTLDQLSENQASRENASRSYLNAKRCDVIQHLLHSKRSMFARYLEALDQKTGHSQQSLFSRIDWQILSQALPVWVVTFDDLHRILPLRYALFDMLIVDEATQCDIASALPAFFRCKRAVIAGDSQQLRHVSFI